MLSNDNQMYQPAMNFIKQIIKQRCKQIFYQTVSSLLSRDIKYAIKKSLVFYQEIPSILLRKIKYAIYRYQMSERIN